MVNQTLFTLALTQPMRQLQNKKIKINTITEKLGHINVKAGNLQLFTQKQGEHKLKYYKSPHL